MPIRSFGQTDVGKQREGNEDYYLIAPELGLYIVCDGMGGHAAGEVASSTAAEAVKNYLSKNLPPIDTIKSEEDYTLLLQIVRESVLDACEKVHSIAKTDASCSGMGTTLTMLLATEKKAAIAHVGDSRLYLCREEKLYKLSNDHTLVAELLYRGAITPEQAKESSYGNVITRSIGRQPSVQVDTLLFDIMAGDTFLLCSDGMSNSVNDPSELTRLMTTQAAEELPQQLIDLANERDGSDNISVIVLQVISDKHSAMHDQAWQKELQLRMETLQQVYLFQYLELKELATVMNISKIKHMQSGEVLIQEGSLSNELYIILEGQLSVSKYAKEITVLNQGNHVGEMALLNHHPRTASVRSLGPSRLLVIERKKFNKLLLQEPKIGAKLLWNLAQELSLRLEESNQLIHLNRPLSSDTLPCPG